VPINSTWRWRRNHGHVDVLLNVPTAIPPTATAGTLIVDEVRQLTELTGTDGDGALLKFALTVRVPKQWNGNTYDQRPALHLYATADGMVAIPWTLRLTDGTGDFGASHNHGNYHCGDDAPTVTAPGSISYRGCGDPH